jgi:type I restriction-modification system DNA methylase subunit
MAKRVARRADLAQYFTPRPVAAFALDALMALGLAPGRLRIADPACGDGVFLREARQRFAEAELWGCDIDPALADAWEAGGLGGPSVHLLVQDGLADAPGQGLRPGAFDLVVGNPPYGFAVPRPGPGERIEELFLRRFVALTRRGGWMAAVVPEGIVANARSQQLRDWLLDRVAIAAIVALPEATFARAGTRARTVVLLGRKGAASTAPVLLASPATHGTGRGALGAYLGDVLAAMRQERGGEG